MDVIMKIEISEEKENIPLELLLLADPSKEKVNEYLENGIVFSAKNGARTVGVMVLVYTKPETMEIMNIAVQEGCQNKGIGKQLILQAIEYAGRKNIKMLEVGTGNSSVGQLSFYQKCGFRITGVDFDYFKKNYNEQIIENGIECRDMIRMQMEI